jgi:hypothetical protein
MSTTTITVTSNADGTLSATSSDFGANPSGNHKSLKALMAWMTGVVRSAFINTGNFSGSD